MGTSPDATAVRAVLASSRRPVVRSSPDHEQIARGPIDDRNSHHPAHRRARLGAGQAGLAAGYHLQRLGIDARIVESDARVGTSGDDATTRSSSTHRPATTPCRACRSRSRRASSRPAARWATTSSRMPATSGSRSTRASGSIGWRRPPMTVGRSWPAPPRRYEAAQVIVATGAFQRPHVPPFAHDLGPGIRQVHSSEYRNPSQLADGPVLVVGLSHSGADLAHEIAATHQVVVSGGQRTGNSRSRSMARSASLAGPSSSGSSGTSRRSTRRSAAGWRPRSARAADPSCVGARPNPRPPASSSSRRGRPACRMESRWWRTGGA